MTTETLPARVTAPELTPFEVMEKVITGGDLGSMQPKDRVAFYWRTCESLGLNPLTRPFEFITLNGKLTMYARKDATDQLRKLNGVSVTKLERDRTDDMVAVTAYGIDRSGRQDSAMGVVAIKGLSGEALANAVMKAETKAKRRLTLSLVGLGFLDESEVEGAERADVDPETGEILAKAAPATLLDAVNAQREKMADAPPQAIAAEIRPESAPEAIAAPEAPAPAPRRRALAPAPAADGPAPSLLCGAPSPYNDGSTCGVAADHSGFHRSLDLDGKVTGSWEAK